MSDTPRSDKAEWLRDNPHGGGDDPMGCVSVEFAQRLERELAAMTERRNQELQLGEHLLESARRDRDAYRKAYRENQSQLAAMTAAKNKALEALKKIEARHIPYFDHEPLRRLIAELEEVK